MLMGQCDKCGTMINRENSFSVPVVSNGQRQLKEICVNCANPYNEHILKFFEQVEDKGSESNEDGSIPKEE